MRRAPKRWAMTVVVAVGMSVCAISPAIAAANWPLYGHDLSNSRNGGSGGPTPARARTLQPAWSFKSTQGDFTGTPVVSAGIVVAGSNGGVVDAFSAITGTLLWSRTVGSQVNGSAAISGGIVYVPVNINEVTGAGTPSVVALSLVTGTPLWQATLDSQPGADVYGSPVVANGRVYIGSSAGYAENNLPNAHDRGSVVALNALTGAVVWKTYTVPPGDDGGAVWSTPALDTSTGRLYVGTGNAYHAPAASTTDAVLALDAKTGAIVASFQATPGDVSFNGSGLDADIGASPNLFVSSSGHKLVGVGDKAGDYWALDRATLKLVWKTSVGPGGGLGGILGSTAWDGSALYGPESQNNETWSLSAAGATRWIVLDGSDNYHLAPVSVAGGVAYSADNQGDLTARSTVDGSLLARVPLAGPSWGGVSISGGTVFVSVGTQGQTGYIEAFRPGCGLVCGLLSGIGETLTEAGQPALGAVVGGLNRSLVAVSSR